MKRIAIKDICEVYDGLHATPIKTESGPIYLGIDAVTEDGILDSSRFVHLSEEDYEKWTKKVTPQENDIVFSYEATLGRYAMIPANFIGCLGRRLAIVRGISKEINVKWLYYYFKSPEWTSFIRNQIVKGSTVDRISIENFPEYTIPSVSLDDQNKIVAVLDRIDRKIVNNNKINDYLDEMAKAIYDYWFVQFDFPDENGNPYKSSGGKIKNGLPIGWNYTPIKNICNILSGFPFQSNDYVSNGKYKLLTIKNVQDTGINLNIDNYINTIPENMPDFCNLDIGNILMSLTGNIGRVGILYSTNCLLNQRVALIQPQNSIMEPFIYCLFKSNKIRYIMESLATGTSQKNLSPIEAGNILIPHNSDIINKFSKKLTPLIDFIILNLRENNNLINLRDWLLPMLMNGQATIED